MRLFFEVERSFVLRLRSALFYGCEAWSLRNEDARRLKVFDH